VFACFSKDIIMIIKNIEITDITTDAVGVGHYEGKAIFIPKTVPGDVVNARIEKSKPNLAYAKKTEYVTKSPDRCAPACKNFSKCGGCQLMHINYDAQLRIKKKFIYDALTRIGGVDNDIEIDMIGAESPIGYRNKMIFPVGENVCGFYENKSHNIVPLEDCSLGIIKSDKLIKTLLEFMNKYNVRAYDEKTGKGIVRRLFVRHGIHSGETMVVISANADSIPHEKELSDMICSAENSIVSIIVNVNTKRTNLVLGEKNRVIYGKEVIKDTLCGYEYEISPHSFFQINPVQTEKLYNRAIDYADIKSDETVLDVYRGIGTISMTASRKAKKVIGIEIVPVAIENAKKNAEDNNVTNCSFLAGKAEELVPKLISGNLKPDKVILDPPRKGSDAETLSAICSAKPEKIVYVSCNPATLARDVKYLQENGYRVDKVTGVDMFPETTHVESVVLMSKVEN